MQADCYQRRHQHLHLSLQQRCRAYAGFTLIEMITVMAVMSVLAGIGVQVVTSLLNSYNRSADQTRLLNEATLTIEYLARNVQQALPNSVRVTESGKCVEFLPVVAGGTYVGQVPDQTNGAAAVSSIETEGYSLGLGSALYVYVAALTNDEVYSSVKGDVSSGENHADSTVQLAASTRFTRNSTRQRFYLTDNPTAFCLRSDQLRKYQNYATPVSSSGSPSNTGALVSDGVETASSSFSISNASSVRNTLLAMTLVFTEGDTTITLQEEVQIRNVP